MVWVYKYDENFVWQAGEEILVDVENGEQVPDGYTQTQPQDGLYIAKYDPDKDEWFETASQDYIDGIKQEYFPTELEIVRQQQAELVFTLMMKGVI